jgi:hypothetical protein
MSGDPEIELLRERVNCAALLERLPPEWRLDRKESTKGALKYRRGAGEVLIISHQGRGWWDPQSERKGDVFDLVQYLAPQLNFGEVRKILRRFVGLSPTFPEARRSRSKTAPDVPIAEKWARRPRLHQNSPVWTYLTKARRLPVRVLSAADAADSLREGPYGSPWFAHRDDAGSVTHIEIRGPDFKASVTGGTKILFRLPGGPQPPTRLALAEAPIDALSLAALEAIRPDTLYAATGGGMGPETIQALERLLAEMAGRPGAVLYSATDANLAGERYAAKHAELANAAGIGFARLRPPDGHGDWNDVLTAGRASL